MAEPKPDEKDIFNAARRIESADERRLYMDRACGDDSALKAQVEALLQVFNQDHGFLESPAREVQGLSDAGFKDMLGAVVGPYTLIEQIGEGGMGTVYRARQEKPVRREVALKIIRPGMDSRQVLARFETERQALALMDHPNIARILDAGVVGRQESAVGSQASGGLIDSPFVVPDSRPYFVMELVQGAPITKYCDDRRLSPAQRLQLFVPVCQAVQHAHQKGIIHRDMKPSNVLVTEYDGRPTPKVIDFGVAKAVDQKLGEVTEATGIGAVIGTLEYMSPEQAQPNSTDIDTRSDVYSLGVLLYELLTGTTPLNRKRFQKAAWYEALRVLREEDPPKPSTRLSTVDELPSIAANRAIEPHRLTGLLRGDLDWIVMKSLDKDRDRRYATANGLAQDVERFLREEPVEAGPPGAGYRLRKFVRRNRGPVVAAGLLALAMIGGIIGTSLGFYRADRERQRAVDLANAETAAKETAEKRFQQLQRVNEMLASIFRDLTPARQRANNKPLGALLGERLANLARQLETESIGDPVTVAQLQWNLGSSLSQLGHADTAIEILTSARSTLIAQLGAEHRHSIGATNTLGTAYQNAGRMDLALPLYEEALRLARATFEPDDKDTMAFLNNVASLYRRMGKAEQGLTLLEELLERRKSKLGPTHYSTLITMNNLGMAYMTARRHDKSLPLLEECLRLRKEALGLGNQETIASFGNVGTAYRHAGHSDKAMPFYEEGLKLARNKLGPDHPYTISALNNLAISYAASGKEVQALPLLIQVAEADERARFQTQHAERHIENLCQLLEKLNQNDVAENWRRKWLAALKERGSQSADIAGALGRLAVNLVRQKKWSEAEATARESITRFGDPLPDSWPAFNARAALGAALSGQRKFGEAEPPLLAGYEGMKRLGAANSDNGGVYLTDALDQLIMLYESWGKPEEAAKWRPRPSSPQGR